MTSMCICPSDYFSHVAPCPLAVSYVPTFEEFQRFMETGGAILIARELQDADRRDDARKKEAT